MLRDPDQEDGWDYDLDANRITIYGPAWDQLRSGEIEELASVQTCDLIVD